MNKDEKQDIIDRINTDIESVSTMEHKRLIMDISEEIYNTLTNYPLADLDMLMIIETIKIFMVQKQ